MGNLTDHARRELELVGERPDTIDWYVGVIDKFASFGHSGGSAAVTIEVIHDLLRFKNLTPLTNDPEEWMLIEYPETATGIAVWQNRRNPEAFSQDGGQHYYLLSEGAHEGNPHPLHESKAR